MGLDIILQNENGEELSRVGDPHNVLHRLLPSHDDSSYQCLRFIDWYADTIFNQLQMQQFLVELNRIRSGAKTAMEKELLDSVQKMAERCRDDDLLYLKFEGD